MVVKNIIFSVIIPTHKRSVLLSRALQSVKSQSQERDLEVIVVSDVIDSSTDAVCNFCLGVDDIYIRRNGVAGPSESRNLGKSLASGHYILFLDDDDAWHPHFLQNLYEGIRLHPNHSLYFDCSVAKETRSSREPLFISESVLNLQNMLTMNVYVKNQVHMSCFAFPRAIVSTLSFDSSMRAYEDWDFQLSVYDQEFPIHVPLLGSRIFEVDDPSSDRRGSSQAATDLNAVFDYLYVYRRHPAPDDRIKEMRQQLLTSVGLEIDKDLL